jgi:hypothetical protein
VSFSIANIISPQTFQSKFAPNYLPAKLTLVACLAACCFVIFGIRLLYGRRNRRADSDDSPAMSQFERKALRIRAAGLDFADREYRYCY